MLLIPPPPFPSFCFVMCLSATVYAELLSRYGHGHPLWNPEPSEGLDGSVRDVQLGDVGYIDAYGGFRRLFNITVDAQHELNAGGVPIGFTPIAFNQSLKRQREDALGPGPLCSEGVNSREIGAHIAGQVTYYFTSRWSLISSSVCQEYTFVSCQWSRACIYV